MSFDKHVSEVCMASYFHFRALHHIQSSLTIDAAKIVASAIEGSRLDLLAHLYKICPVFS